MLLARECSRGKAEIFSVSSPHASASLEQSPVPLPVAVAGLPESQLASEGSPVDMLEGRPVLLMALLSAASCVRARRAPRPSWRGRRATWKPDLPPLFITFIFGSASTSKWQQPLSKSGGGAWSPATGAFTASQCQGLAPSVPKAARGVRRSIWFWLRRAVPVSHQDGQGLKAAGAAPIKSCATVSAVVLTVAAKGKPWPSWPFRNGSDREAAASRRPMPPTKTARYNAEDTYSEAAARGAATAARTSMVTSVRESWSWNWWYGTGTAARPAASRAASDAPRRASESRVIPAARASGPRRDLAVGAAAASCTAHIAHTCSKARRSPLY
mmetsp:Transcript_30028/g.75780  ORF Transcript_30028/g.75780 Transcript_30028/m.75780 type:complete len:328 (-) Transcript_30028:465-1448(-)